MKRNTQRTLGIHSQVISNKTKIWKEKYDMGKETMNLQCKKDASKEAGNTREQVHRIRWGWCCLQLSAWLVMSNGVPQSHNIKGDTGERIEDLPPWSSSITRVLIPASLALTMSTRKHHIMTCLQSNGHRKFSDGYTMQAAHKASKGFEDFATWIFLTADDSRFVN